MLKEETAFPLSGPSLVPKTVEKAIILLHGYGANGDDLFDLAPAFGRAFPTAAFYCPNAPEELPGMPFFNARQWFPLDNYDPELYADDFSLFSKGSRAMLPLLGASRALIDLMIYAIARRHGISSKDIGIGGFSQGGLMALVTALSRKDALAACVSMSGVPLFLDTKAFTPDDIKSRPPVTLIHGDRDPVVPFKSMEATEQGLKSAGIACETHPISGLPHGIDDNSLAFALKAFQKAF